MLNYDEMDNVLKKLDKCAENMKTATETQGLLKDVLETTKEVAISLENAEKNIDANAEQIKNIEEKHKQIHSLLEDISTEYKKIHSVFELLEIKQQTMIELIETKHQTVKELLEKEIKALQIELKDIHQEIEQNQKNTEKKKHTFFLTIGGLAILGIVATVIGFFI